MIFSSVVLAEVGLQDGFSWEDIVAFSIGFIAVITALGMIHRAVVKPAMREFREFKDWLRKFQRDWDGEEASPGRDRVPGVMERLNRVDGELQRNGGNSVKDKVIEASEQIGVLEERVGVIEARQIEIQEVVNKKS